LEIRLCIIRLKWVGWGFALLDRGVGRVKVDEQ